MHGRLDAVRNDDSVVLEVLYGDVAILLAWVFGLYTVAHLAVRRFAPAKAVCWCGAATPRPRSTWPGWPA